MEVFLQVVGILTTIPFAWVYKLLKWAATWPEEEGIYDRSDFEQGSHGVFGFEEGGPTGFNGSSACLECADADVGSFQGSKEPSNCSREFVETLQDSES